MDEPLKANFKNIVFLQITIYQGNVTSQYCHIINGVFIGYL